MSTFSINSNIIHTEMIRNGCFDCQFDLNYPSQLNQITSQEQFEESINEINRSTNISFIEKFKIIICLLCAIIVLIISAVGGIFQDTLNDKKYFFLVAIGVIMIIIGIVLNVLFCSRTNSRRFSPIKKQIKTDDDLPIYESIQFNQNSVGYHSTSNEQEQNPPPPYSSHCT
ncbi:unnamed protein product [Adineta steineri]|uniref:Transmembrane protein n=1 Tax=Adineta steineri TaxID=433720 RepID=A0A818NYX5_9BILA|nr:unnamed protein product [Adineta steineri]CAF4023693.1 unnamed protein product [Adineta steineri]CAF4120959.1 unnamed protein product [Adineta steineri]